MDEIEIPQYFLCPISLQIMKDPVTTVTGITYDRESIEQWLTTDNAATCPVTKQPLPRGSDLTPNHMLRRLIQSWCVVNAENGIDRIPTPKFPVHRSVVLKLVRQLNNDLLRENALDKMIELANESVKNKNSLAESGVVKAVISFILKCLKDGRNDTFPLLEKALRILILTWSQSVENKKVVENNFDLINSLLWLYNNSTEASTVQTNALLVLKNVIEIASSNLLEKLNQDFFEKVVNVLKKNVSPPAIRSAIKILIQICPFGANKVVIIESGAVYALIQLEWTDPEKKTSELIFRLLANLCSCADGRQEFLKHAGGIAVTTKRLLRISPVADEFVVSVLESIARSAATKEVVMEMLRVGAVAKLCMVLQADCESYLKKKAREILRMHSLVWSNSPCIQVYLLTRFNR